MTIALRPSSSSHRIIGIGNAGVNFLDRLLLASPAFAGLVAINNDSESLAASVVPTQIALSVELEPAAALAEMTSRFSEEMGDASLVLLCGGLGGALASALLPEVAALSKAAKKVTLACVSLPFSFEGKRAQSIAAQSLAVLEQICDGVILLDNNALCSPTASTSAFGETFTASDEAMQVCLPALLAMLLNKGPVRIARASLLKALHRPGAKTHFGYGQATGANRLHEAVERALKNPLLDRGRFLAKADAVFLLLRGPNDLSFAEAQAAMQEIERFVASERDIQLSVQAEEPAGTPLQLFVLATAEGTPKSISKPESIVRSEPAIEIPNPSTQKVAPPKTLDTFKEKILPQENELFPEIEDQKLLKPKTAVEAKPSSTIKPKQTQGALNLTAAQRGRFDKSEPTIVEGEDLDTPTYLRLGLKLS